MAKAVLRMLAAFPAPRRAAMIAARPVAVRKAAVLTLVVLMADRRAVGIPATVPVAATAPVHPLTPAAPRPSNGADGLN